MIDREHDLPISRQAEALARPAQCNQPDEAHRIAAIYRHPSASKPARATRSTRISCAA
jgi:hypothetical protein